MKIRNLAFVFASIEALFLLSLATYLFIRSATSKVEELDAVIAEIVMLVLGAAGLFFAGRGVMREKRYGRGAIVMANLIALGVVKYQAEAGLYYVAVPIAVLAVATLFMVLKIASQENKSK